MELQLRLPARGLCAELLGAAGSPINRVFAHPSFGL